MVLILATIINIPLKPENNYKTTNITIQFQKTGSFPIILDNNKYFTSPIILNKPYIIRLEPDTYYWKSTGITRTSTFTIDSKVAISLINENSTYEIQNKGNVQTNIEIKKNSILTGLATLDIKEKLRVNLTDEEVIASQK